MTDLKQILTRLYGREPTKKEYMRVDRVASAMGVSDNDEFIILFACLEAYHSLFDRIPELTTDKVEEASKAAEKQATTLLRQWMQAQRDEFDRVMKKTEEMVEAMRSASKSAKKEAADTIREIAAEQQNALTQTVIKAAEKVADEASTRTRAKWIGWLIVICCLCLGSPDTKLIDNPWLARLSSRSLY